MNVDAFGDAIPVAAFGPRMVCTGCGIVGADVRPIIYLSTHSPSPLVRAPRSNF
jgi:hypothetical protein